MSLNLKTTVVRLNRLGICISLALAMSSKLSYAEEMKPMVYQCPNAQLLSSRSQKTDAKAKNRQKLIVPDNKIHASSDDIDGEGDKIIYKGNVIVKQGTSRLEAEKVLLDKKSNQLEATGKLSFTSEQVEISSEFFQINVEDQSLKAKNAQYKLTEAALHGKAEQIEVQASGKLTLNEASFTSCSPEDEVWKINASKIKIDTESGRGVAQNMTLRIQDVPILYLPYIQFPVNGKRLSGLLAPSLSNSDRNGNEITLPFYWNIAENFDATITPRYMSERGTQLITEFRYLTEGSNGIVEAEYLGDDKDRANTTSQDRHRFRLKHHSRFDQHWQADIDFTDLSDDSYYFDLGSDLVSSTEYEIVREASIQYQGDNWQISALTSDAQTLNTLEDPYKRLPQIQWQSQFDLDLSNRNIIFNFNGEFTSFDRDNAITADRLVIEPSLSFPMEWLSGYLKPSLKLNIRNYEQRDPLDQISLSDNITTPIFSIDSGLYLERVLNVSGRSFLQTLEPRLYYLYVPDKNQQDIQLFDTALATASYQRLFMDNRYSGLDRIGDANQFSLGINSRIISREDGEELLSIGLGQTFFLEDREVSLLTTAGSSLTQRELLDANTSPFLADVTLNISKYWRLNSTFEWQPDTKQTESSSMQLHYQPNEMDVYNIGHRRRILGTLDTLATQGTEDEVEQLDLSFSKKINNKWRVVGRWYQDLNQNRSIETLIGFEYDSCCWALRVVHRKFLNIALSETGVPLLDEEGVYDKGIFVQFVLKGLSSLGSTSFLENSIQGYHDPYR